MGTGYDCFDVMSHTRSPLITPEQRRWRNLLVAAMAKRGFRNYSREWWHFTYGRRAARSTIFRSCRAPIDSSSQASAGSTTAPVMLSATASAMRMPSTPADRMPPA